MTPTFFVPLAFAPAATTALLFPQEPTTTDKPAGTNPVAPASPGAGTTGAPQPQPQQQPQSPCGFETVAMMAAVLVLMYFMVMRPEQKRRKEQQALLASIKVNDRVVTLGGMHGVVAKLADKTVTLRVDNVHMTFDRSAVARVERDDLAAPPAKA
jgi:preprotein translocase subunit YajC